MTKEELKAILEKEPSEVVKDLQKSSYTLPSWADLNKQYDPLLHEIKVNTKRYPIKQNELGYDDFKRIVLGLQKLAVARIAQAMFTNPVERLWNNEPDNKKEQTAVNIIEQLYKVENYSDSENVERCKRWGASCQFATIWKTYESPNEIEGVKSKLKLTHTTYSEMDGYKLYAQNDENGNLLVLLIMYTDSNNKDQAYVYSNLETPLLQVFDNGENGWALNTELSKELSVFPAIYLSTSEPVWGGLAGTALIEEMEEMLSFQGLYIKKNAAPLFLLDMGDTTSMQNVSTVEKSDDSRRVIRGGKGASMQDVTWQGATEAVKLQYKTLREAFFEQVQMPDISFANMINSNTSAENKEMLFADAKNKAQDLGGEWGKMLYDEIMLILEFAKIMFPDYEKEFSKLRARSVIKPYSIRSKKENAEYVSLAGESMSRTTKIRILGEVDNIEDEVNEIEQEISSQANQGI